MKKNLLLVFAALIAVACNSNRTPIPSDSNAVANDSVVEKVDPLDTFTYTAYTTLADIMAGKEIKDSTYFRDIITSQAYANHSKVMTDMWARYKAQETDRVMEWSRQNLSDAPTRVFYPFSGPDFNYLDAMFPECEFAALFALEQAGCLPFSDEKSLSHPGELFNVLRASIGANLSLSFFLTKRMQVDFYASYVKGSLSVAMLFVASRGYEVIVVNPVDIDSLGNIFYTEPEKLYAHTLDKDFSNGYEIVYRREGEKKYRRLYYFNRDLSNGNYDKLKLDNFVRVNFAGQACMTKAASYHLHAANFSNVRTSMLTHCDLIVNAPSGIPYTSFEQDKWNIKYYGSFRGPIPLFHAHPDTELKDAYAKNGPEAINFKYDYDTHNSSFIVARRKK